MSNAVEEAAVLIGEQVDEFTVLDLGPHLTCGEAEAFAALLEAIGHSDLSTALIEGHAAEDDEGDLHYQGAA